MTDREYLRSLGFSVGERGRFSKEMLQALADRANAETVDSVNNAREVMGLDPITQTPTRPAQELWGYTKEGSKIEFIMCFMCADHMMWCECTGGPYAPPSIVRLTGAAKDIAQLHPRMLESLVP